MLCGAAWVHVNTETAITRMSCSTRERRKHFEHTYKRNTVSQTDWQLIRLFSILEDTLSLYHLPSAFRLGVSIPANQQACNEPHRDAEAHNICPHSLASLTSVSYHTLPESIAAFVQTKDKARAFTS